MRRNNNNVRITIVIFFNKIFIDWNNEMIDYENEIVEINEISVKDKDCYKYCL